MGKHLSEMTLEELWQLFPIFLVAPRPEWHEWYEEERAALVDMLSPESVVRISHIGSTSINGIWAKDIVDILVELTDAEALAAAGETAHANGWVLMYSDDRQIDLNKGYTDDGFAEKVYHLHMRIVGDNDELFFRDYLNDHPDIAKAYESMKLRLWHEYEHDREGYTNAKHDFIVHYTALAKSEYKGRY